MNIEEFSEWAYSIDDILNALDSAGLKLIAMYDDDTFNPPSEHSQRVVFVSKKVR